MKTPISLNPTAEELERWAGDEDSSYPPDYDFIVARDQHLHSTVLRLASDPSCPTRRFFLNVLYIVAGKAVANGFRELPRRALDQLVTTALKADEPLTSLWARRTVRLLRHPEEFDFEYWCEFGAALDDTEGGLENRGV